jgi:hypothetical protein
VKVVRHVHRFPGHYIVRRFAVIFVAVMVVACDATGLVGYWTKVQ